MGKMPKYCSEAVKVQTFSFLRAPKSQQPNVQTLILFCQATSQPQPSGRGATLGSHSFSVSPSQSIAESCASAHAVSPSRVKHSFFTQSSTHFHLGDFHREFYPGTFCLRFPIVRWPASNKPSDYNWKIRRLSSNKSNDQQVNLANCEARSVSSKHPIPVSQWLSSTTF